MDSKKSWYKSQRQNIQTCKSETWETQLGELTEKPPGDKTVQTVKRHDIYIYIYRGANNERLARRWGDKPGTTAEGEWSDLESSPNPRASGGQVEDDMYRDGGNRDTEFVSINRRQLSINPRKFDNLNCSYKSSHDGKGCSGETRSHNKYFIPSYWSTNELLTRALECFASRKGTAHTKKTQR